MTRSPFWERLQAMKTGPVCSKCGEARAPHGQRYCRPRVTPDNTAAPIEELSLG